MFEALEDLRGIERLGESVQEARAEGQAGFGRTQESGQGGAAMALNDLVRGLRVQEEHFGDQRRLQFTGGGGLGAGGRGRHEGRETDPFPVAGLDTDAGEAAGEGESVEDLILEQEEAAASGEPVGAIAFAGKVAQQFGGIEEVASIHLAFGETKAGDGLRIFGDTSAEWLSREATVEFAGVVDSAGLDPVGSHLIGEGKEGEGWRFEFLAEEIAGLAGLAEELAEPREMRERVGTRAFLVEGALVFIIGRGWG